MYTSNFDASANPSSYPRPARFALRPALRIFKVQPLRALFAMLGVFLGALLLTGILHILGGISLQVENQARSLGSHVATVSAERPVFSRLPEAAKTNDATEAGGDAEEKNSMPHGAQTVLLNPSATLTPEDMEAAVYAIPNIRSGVPFVTLDGQLFHGRKMSHCSILGVTPEYMNFRSVSTAFGRFFNEVENHEAALVCVLGDALARRIFNEPELAPGKFVRIHKSSVRVVGVMEPKGADSNGTNMDEIVFIPLRTGMYRLSSQDHVTGFWVEMQSRAAIPEMQRSLEKLLRGRHHLASVEKNDFSINFAGQVEDMVGDAMELMTTLGLIGAGISFFVGSLGIFSIMILMVHSRKVEIGIRRAVGAPRRLIMQQFLLEAGLMAGVGGTFGSLVGLGIMEVITAFSLLPHYLNIPLAVGVCFLSVGCGLGAGAYPAWKAARQGILAALRD